MTDEPRLPRPRLRVTTRPLVAGEVAPADTVPEMEAAPAKAPLWPRIIHWAKRVAAYLGIAGAVLGAIYGASRVMVSAERKEVDQAETTALVRSMSERLARMEGRLEVIINMVRPTNRKELAE